MEDSRDVLKASLSTGLSCQLEVEVIFWPLRFQGDAWLMAALIPQHKTSLSSRDVYMRRNGHKKVQTTRW